MSQMLHFRLDSDGDIAGWRKETEILEKRLEWRDRDETLWEE